MKRPMILTVRGRGHEWVFRVDADPAHLSEWRADGLTVNEVYAAVPEWAASLGLAPLVMTIQRVWQWLRLL